MEPFTKQSILCISAHPDDEVGGVGGTLLKFKRAGARLTLVLLTSGEMPDGEAASRLSETRIGEFQAVARELGATAKFLNFVRYFQFSLETLIPLVREIRATKPSIVFAPSTSEEAPEHVMAGRLAKEACRMTRRSKLFSLGQPWRVSELREYELDNAMTTFDLLEDISDVIDEKKKLFNLYASQTSNKDYVSAFVDLNQYRGITKRTGRFAEAFRINRIL